MRVLLVQLARSGRCPFFLAGRSLWCVSTNGLRLHVSLILAIPSPYRAAH